MPRTQCRNRHVPEAASLRTGTGGAAQAPHPGRVRPPTGARCGKAARRDLRGGRAVRPVPTATIGGLDGRERLNRAIYKCRTRLFALNCSAVHLDYLPDAFEAKL